MRNFFLNLIISSKLIKELPWYHCSQENKKTTKSQEDTCIHISHKCKNRAWRHFLKTLFGTIFNENMYLCSKYQFNDDALLYMSRWVSNLKEGIDDGSGTLQRLQLFMLHPHQGGTSIVIPQILDLVIQDLNWNLFIGEVVIHP